MSIQHGRFTDNYEGPLVIFIIGMRVNRFFRVGKWLPVARAMGPMIAELSADPESGFMGAEVLRQGLRTVTLIQYWRDFERLEAYARNRDRKHWPAWTAFNKAVGNDGTVGIFHETYCVPGAATKRYTPTCRPSGSERSQGRLRRPARVTKRVRG